MVDWICFVFYLSFLWCIMQHVTKAFLSRIVNCKTLFFLSISFLLWNKKDGSFMCFITSTWSTGKNYADAWRVTQYLCFLSSNPTYSKYIEFWSRCSGVWRPWKLTCHVSYAIVVEFLKTNRNRGIAIRSTK